MVTIISFIRYPTIFWVPAGSKSKPIKYEVSIDYYYGPQGHPYNCFPTCSNYIYIYIYIYMLVSLTQVCIVYLVKEVVIPGGSVN